MKVKQFDIWQVDLSPTKGSEQKGMRPCLILQTNASGNVAPTTLIVPFTSKRINKIYSFEVVVKPSKVNGLREVSKLMFDQIRVIDKVRLKKCLGSVDKNYHEDILSALKIIFDLEGDFRS